MFDLLVETLGQRIRRLRDAKGWSLNELARRANMKGTAGIWKIEQDKVKDPYTIAAIAEALGTSVEYLRDGSDEIEEGPSGKFLSKNAASGRFTHRDDISNTLPPDRDLKHPVDPQAELDHVAATLRKLAKQIPSLMPAADLVAEVASQSPAARKKAQQKRNGATPSAAPYVDEDDDETGTPAQPRR